LAIFVLQAVSAIAEESALPGWSAPPSTEVVAEEKVFTSGDLSLRGTLYLPKRPGPVAALIAFHAASSPTRDLRLYDHLKRMLPSLGIAVFVFDRRGSGSSEKTSGQGDYAALADDGIAAFRMLERDSRIDAKKIGFWGLSQGGWLALLAGSRCPEAAFVISVSAPLTTADVQMNFAVANILRIKGYSQADVELALSARTAVDDFERGKLDRASAQRRVDLAAGKPWFDLIYLSRTFADPERSSWAREIRNDPVDSLKSLHMPALFIFGARDPWVPARLSAQLLEQRLRRANVTTIVVADADHVMMQSATPEQQIDPAAFAAQAPESPEYFGVLASWLTTQKLTSTTNPPT
jgi:pimeloyl-ACP methyl ester carboxylesterase